MKFRPVAGDFYELFTDLARHLVLGAELLAEMLAEGSDRDDTARRMREAEHAADETTHAIVRRVNTTFVTPATNPGGLGSDRRGEVISQGGSRLASEADFEATAKQLKHFGKLAADHGLDISIEVHQGSIADNSKSTLHLLDLVGLDNVGANPDLGNVYWHYEHPEETNEQAIVALAPRSTYWHCKNLRRLHIPELNKSWFIRVPLDDGDIDYRFAISAMVDAGYKGYLAVEGSNLGDQLTHDKRSADYVRSVLKDRGQ